MEEPSFWMREVTGSTPVTLTRRRIAGATPGNNFRPHLWQEVANTEASRNSLPIRSVAQSGRVPGSDPGGRGFEPHCSDPMTVTGM